MWLAPFSMGSRYTWVHCHFLPSAKGVLSQVPRFNKARKRDSVSLIGLLDSFEAFSSAAGASTVFGTLVEPRWYSSTEPCELQTTRAKQDFTKHASLLKYVIDIIQHVLFFFCSIRGVLMRNTDQSPMILFSLHSMQSFILLVNGVDNPRGYIGHQL